MSIYLFSSLGLSSQTGRTVDPTNGALRQDESSADFGDMLRMEAARQPSHEPSSFVATGTMGREHYEADTADARTMRHGGAATPSDRSTTPGNHATQVALEAEDFTIRTSQTLHATGSGPASRSSPPQELASALHGEMIVGRAIARPNGHPIAPTSALEVMPESIRNGELLSCRTMQPGQRQSSSVPFSVSFQLADDYLQVRLTLHVSAPEERLRLRTTAAQLLADYNWPNADLHINEGRYAKALYARKGVYVGG